MRNRVFLALFLASTASHAAPSAPPIQAGSHISAYYSTLDLEASLDGDSESIDGDGGGLALWLGNGIGLFTAEFQSASLDGNVFGVPVDADVREARVGMGYRFINTTTSGLWLRAEYVRFDADISAEDFGTADDTQDGYAVHAGGMVGNGAIRGYGEIGTVQLKDLDGLEYKVGLSFQPGLVGGFVEYRLTDLETDELGIDEEYDNVRVGLRLAFQ